MSKPRIHTMRNVLMQMAEMIKKLSASCTDTVAVQQAKELTRQADEILDDRSGT